MKKSLPTKIKKVQLHGFIVCDVFGKTNILKINSLHPSKEEAENDCEVLAQEALTNKTKHDYQVFKIKVTFLPK